MLNAVLSCYSFFFSSRRRHTRSVSAFLLNRSSDLLLRHGSDKTLQVGYANHFYRSAHKFEQICRHRLRRQNVGYSNFSQPQSHLSFCVLLQYLVERRRVVTQLVSWIKHSVDRFVIVSIFIPKLRLILILNSFLGSSDSLVFSELFHSLAPRPLAARSISDFLLTYLAT